MSKYQHLFRTVEVDLSMFVAANVANLSYDTLVCPYAHLSDGFVDILYAQ